MKMTIITLNFDTKDRDVFLNNHSNEQSGWQSVEQMRRELTRRNDHNIVLPLSDGLVIIEKHGNSFVPTLHRAQVITLAQ